MRLRWKLTLSYTLVTAGAILLVEMALLAVAVFFLTRADTLGRILVPILSDAVLDVAPALEHRPPEDATLQAWVEALVRTGQIPRKERQGLKLNLDPASLRWALFGDEQGRVVAASAAAPCTAGQPMADCLPIEAVMVARRALAGERDSATLTQTTSQGLYTAVPVFGTSGRPVAALVLYIDWPTSLQEWPREILATLLPSAAVVTLFAALVGTVFGFFTARGLSRRLAALARAADAWSQGDFSIQVRDHAADELGVLARRLNRMAEQLQNLLQARQELAALEERNRLARELHDAVKQQVFAAGLQLAAARQHLKTNPSQAETALAQAEALLRQAQGELTALLRELRPAALEGKGLIPALETYLSDWQEQTGIRAELYVKGRRNLPLEMEQNLFRVVQEALANVARHSAAQRVVVRLAWEPEALFLEIQDDGRGFDPTRTRGRGMGLTSMEERIRRLGGAWQVESAPGRGTRLTARVPLPRAG